MQSTLLWIIIIILMIAALLLFRKLFQTLKKIDKISKEMLLIWAKESSKNHHLRIVDLKESWQDALGFLAILRQCLPRRNKI